LKRKLFFFLKRTMSTEKSLMSLSNEVLLTIFQHLHDAQSVVRLGATCTRLAAIARDETIWEPLVRSYFPLAVKFVAVPSKQDAMEGGHSRAGSSRGEEPRITSGVSFYVWTERRILLGEEEDAEKFSTWRAAYRQCSRSGMMSSGSGTQGNK
jgi:hypothetical protein